MRVVILPDADSVARFASEQIIRQVASNPHSVLGLATGSTPVATYRKLIEAYRAKRVSFASVTTFNLDEYVGLPADHPECYLQFMQRELFSQLDIPSSQTHLPNGNAKDLVGESALYERMINATGGIDLQLLGIGTDGHIAFNEPGSSLASRTRVKTLTRRTRQDNARFFASYDDVPKTALTMGIGTILESKRVLLLATGEGKAQAIRDTIEGPVSARVPGSALQLHPNATAVLDQSAASRLEWSEYYQDSEANRTA